jgi:hypothetical protein
MHRYSVTSDKHGRVELYLALASVVTTWAISALLSARGISLPWWVESPSVMGLYGGFYQLFDKLLWRTRLTRLAGLVAVPDLSGTWSGKVSSSYDSYIGAVEAAAIISQTWTHIAIRLSTPTSKSESEAAAIVSRPSDGALLVYEYLSMPSAGSLETLHAHRGTARLELSRDGGAAVLEVTTADG